MSLFLSLSPSLSLFLFCYHSPLEPIDRRLSFLSPFLVFSLPRVMILFFWRTSLRLSHVRLLPLPCKKSKKRCGRKKKLSCRVKRTTIEMMASSVSVSTLPSVQVLSDNRKEKAKEKGKEKEKERGKARTGEQTDEVQLF